MKLRSLFTIAVTFLFGLSVQAHTPAAGAISISMCEESCQVLKSEINATAIKIQKASGQEKAKLEAKLEGYTFDRLSFCTDAKGVCNHVKTLTGQLALKIQSEENSEFKYFLEKNLSAL